jgi:uncharacterized protein (DUF1778 family)
MVIRCSFDEPDCISVIGLKIKIDKEVICYQTVAMAKGRDKPPNSLMLSLRVTPSERRLLEEAAASKGWKLATFLKAAALERAANVLNLSRQTTFNFHGLAAAMAESLAGERQVGLATEEDTGSYMTFGRYRPREEILLLDLERAIKNGRVHVSECHPEPLSPGGLAQLEEAARLGGSEFLAAVVAECRRRFQTSAESTELPPPIDPRSIND